MGGHAFSASHRGRVQNREKRPAFSETESDGGWHAYRNLDIRFSDGSLRRPDVAVFCRVPDEFDEAVTLVPEAVIEIVSEGSERKDLELSPPFYLRQGVRDVVVLDPYTGIVWHHRNDSPVERHQSPIEIALRCGCAVTV